MNTTWYRHGICTPTSCDLGSRTRPSSKFLRVRGGSRGGTLNGGRLPETSNCFCHPGKAGGLPLCAQLSHFEPNNGTVECVLEPACDEQHHGPSHHASPSKWDSSASACSPGCIKS